MGRKAGIAAAGRQSMTIKQAEHLIAEARQLFGQRRTDDARARLRATEKAFPRDPEVLHAIALAEIEHGDMRRALIHLRRVVDITPKVTEAHYYLGLALWHLGRLEEALESFRTAASLNPDFVPARMRFAATLGNLGRFDESLEENRRILARWPGNADAYQRITFEKPSALTQEDRIEMERLAEDPATSARDRSVLGIALAELHDREGDVDTAFKWLKLSNDLKATLLRAQDTETDDDHSILPPNARTRPVSPEAAVEFQRNFIEWARRTFAAETFARFADRGYRSATPIFIVGLPRSGSTLVEQILASHPKVKAGGESRVFSDVVGLRERSVIEAAGVRHALAPKLPDGFLRSLGRAYVDRITGEAGRAERITDKQLYNYNHVGEIHLMLPAATIIHIRRDPVDNCLACFRRNFQSGNEYTYDLTRLGEYYVGYRQLMEHWDSVLPGRVLTVDYEELVADPEPQVRRMLDACGLNWNDACLRFHEQRHAVRTASLAQVRQPIYRTSVARWRRYERHLGPLLEALGPYAPDRG